MGSHLHGGATESASVTFSVASGAEICAEVLGKKAYTDDRTLRVMRGREPRIEENQQLPWRVR
jgi:hypothetical protein